MKKATSFFLAASAVAMATTTVGCSTSYERVVPVAANDNYTPEPPKPPTPIAANDNHPILTDASGIHAIITDVAVKNGINPHVFLHMAKIESAFNPNAFHPKSKACGLFQFILSTAKAYKLTNCRDPRANAEAAAMLFKDNARYLRNVLGREPSAGEIYLAHQQGAGGAAKLLTHPHKLARDIVGAKAVTMNGGHLRMTGIEFAQLWTSKFALFNVGIQ
ncbi:MAG: transglycosylase SLT domain-containing protein [Rhizobiaceae bacterium]|nr:transglycosylase SLT domain-containing protein [Rhizobiaceae bacterium]